MKSDDSKTTDTIDDALPSEDPQFRCGPGQYFLFIYFFIFR